MTINRIFANVGMGVVLAYALGAAQTSSGSKTNGAGTSAPSTQASGSNPAAPASSSVASGQDGSPGQVKNDPVPGKATTEGVAERKKFDTVEDAIEKSSEKLDQAIVKAEQERNKARHEKEKGKKTPQSSPN